MYTLLQKAVGYFSGTEVDAELDSNVCERPKLEDFLSGSFFESERFEGVITSITNQDVVVNNDIYFSIPIGQSKRKFKVGDSVQGVAERKGKHEAWRAVSLGLLTKNEGWDNGHPVVSGEAISCRDLDAGIPGILKNDLFSAMTAKQNLPKSASDFPKQVMETEKQQIIVGKVKAVHGSTVTLNENNYFNLSDAKSAFELLEGDWIVCTLADDHNTNKQSQRNYHLPGFIKVSQIEPLRKKKIRGNVTHCYSSHCVINSEVFCSSHSSKELSLTVGDNLTVDIIESNQGHFGWRAISLSFVAPPTIKDLRSSILNLSMHRGLEGNAKSADLFEDKDDIIISRSLRFSEVMLGCQSHLNVSVKNTGKKNQMLYKVYFVSTTQECQFSIVRDSIQNQDDGIIAVLKPQANIVIRIQCSAKLLGLSKQLCIFDFGRFRMGRYVSVSVGDHHIMNMAPSNVYVPRDRSSISPVWKGDTRVVRGEKPFRAPAFMPHSLPSYQVPEYMWSAIENGDHITDTAPVLLEPVTSDNHQDKFSLLLHLEEIEMNMQMRQFDMMRTIFSAHGEYLSLVVPGLAEKRPSLMIGDTVIASSPCDTIDTEYEGYIHEVLNTQILLKFHPSFHNQYRGEDYTVRFNFNRTPLRRCHFALKFAMEQLGSDVLFPKKLKMQLPQIAYVDLEAVSPKCTSSKSNICHQPQNSECSHENILNGRRPSNVKENGNGMTVKAGSGSHGLQVCRLHNTERVNVVDKVDINSQKTMNHYMESSVKLHSEKQTEVNVRRTCKNLDQKIENSNKVEDLASKEINIHGNEHKLNNNIVRDGRSEDRSSFKCKEEQNRSPSDSATRMTSKRGSSVTPPRIPVVTRLFGVPSSGSSTNSSMCCSDDETKGSCDTESNRKTQPCSGANYKSKNLIDVDGAVRELKFGNSNEQKGSLADSYSLLPAEMSRHSEKRKNSELCKDASKLNDLIPHEKNGNVMESHTILTPINQVDGYCIPVLPILSSKERKSKDQVPILRWHNEELNAEQKLAVRRILEGSTRPLPYVIYGPPGTGKTVTLVEAVLQIFTLVHHSRILIVTPSNSAADLVTERLIQYGRMKIADLVRLNSYQRKEDTIPESLQAFCCNGDQLTVRVRQRVIVTTATTAGLLYTLSLHNGHFSHVFVDEAGQLTEPECLVALGLVNSVSGQVVLAGDPQQLGPVVQSKKAKKYGLQESLLHRLCSSILYQPEEKSSSSAWIYEPRLVTLLVKNYRSHPDIYAIPSKLFYHGSLQACSCKAIQEKLLKWEELPNASCPLLFHGLVSENLQEGDSPSWFNPTEAFQVVRYAKSLIGFGLIADDIGIITPYRKQVQKIRKLLTIFGIAEGIKVGTVEEFQGQERTAVIISTVRSSEKMLEVDIQHSLGFVKCRRRFNVAITRAQSLLVVVGNPFLLLLDDCWLDFISFCIQKGVYRGPELQLCDQE